MNRKVEAAERASEAEAATRRVAKLEAEVARLQKKKGSPSWAVHGHPN
jgi:hypothetical protein